MNAVETGFYYLQSRYYDAWTCRFINADEPVMLGLSTSNLIRANLFAYWGNNPVMNSDPTGYFHIKIADMAKLVLLGAKLGAFWGPVASITLSIIMGVMGLTIGGQIAGALWECVWTGKEGIEFKVKTGWFGIPYAIYIYAR